MNKQEQWKLAAIIMREVDRLNPGESEYWRRERAEKALYAVYIPLRSEYPWREVIRSHRSRSATAAAKKALAS